MKKIIGLVVILVIAAFAIFLGVKQVTKKPPVAKPVMELTVYTLSAADTKRWEKVKGFETREAKYTVNVKEETSPENIFKRLISDGSTSVGFGINKAQAAQFNNTVDKTVKDGKNNKLLGIEFFTFSTEEKGFVIADFDLGSEETNSQKAGVKDFYKKLYEASDFK